MTQNLAAHQQSPLAGRQKELHRLWDLFEATLTGGTHIVLVSGEPGIGKTRLLREVAVRAEQSGALVLRGDASEAEGMPPYLPFLEALGSYIRTAPHEHLRAQAGPVAPILATILPELTVILEELPSSYPLPAEQTRLRLYEAVGMFLASIATTAPLVVLLDDLQWADPASLGLLLYMVRRRSSTRLFLLGTYRTGELAGNPALERALVELTRLRLLTPLSLGPLSEAEIASLASGVLGALVDPQTARLLYIHSEGNPFFAEELLRAWVETGTLSARAGLFTLVRKLPNVLPSSIVGIVRERLSRLPATTVESLRIAALIGRTFDVTFLAEVLGQEAEAVEESLLVASGRGSFRRTRKIPLPSATIKCASASLPRSPLCGVDACMASLVVSWRHRLTREVLSTSLTWPSTSHGVAIVHAERTTHAVLPSRHSRHLHLRMP